MKCKQLLFPLLAVAMVASCQKESKPVYPLHPDKGYEVGVPTDLALRVKIKDISTRTHDQTPLTIAGEKRLTDIIVIVFDENGIYETSAENTTGKWNIMDNSEGAVYDGTGNGTDLQLNVESGEKSVVAIANTKKSAALNQVFTDWINAAIASPTTDGKLSDLKQISLGTDNTNTDYTKWLKVSDIATNYNSEEYNLFLMVGITENVHVQPALVVNQHQYITVDLERPIAKYMVKTNSANVITDIESHLGGNFALNGFFLHQKAKGTYVFARSNVDNVTFDGNASIVGETAGNLYSKADLMESLELSAGQLLENNAVYKTIHLNSFQNENLESSYAYAPENIHANSAKIGAMTYAIVKANFHPTSNIQGTLRPGLGDSFWVVVGDDYKTGRNHAYYSNINEAQLSVNNGAHGDLTNPQVIEYVNGDCYYRVILKSISGNTTTKRNTFYQVNITGISELGAHSIDKVISDDGNLIPDSSIRLDAVIHLLAWNIELIDTGIGE